MKRSRRTLLIIGGGIVLCLALALVLKEATRRALGPPPPANVAWSDFLMWTEADTQTEPHVARVTITDGEYRFVVSDPAKGTMENKTAMGPRDVDPALVDKLRSRGIVVTIEAPDEPSEWTYGVLFVLKELLEMAKLAVVVGGVMWFLRSRRLKPARPNE